MPSLIKPFAALRPVEGRAIDVVAPPYDVMNTEEAREMAAGCPWSFLHISRPEIDLPEGIDPYTPEVYAKARENLDHMISEGILTRDAKPCYYAYRLVMGEHVQTGLVAVASVDAYQHDRIKKHELTRPQKEDDRVRQIEALNAQTGPVFLSYKANVTVDELLRRITATAPEVNVMACDGVEHALWVISDADAIDTLTNAFDEMNAVYVADGHHRSAAGTRVAETRKATNPDHTGEESYNYFLSVLFPHDQMQILDYNRVIRDLNGYDETSFLAAISQRFCVEKQQVSFKPSKPAEFGMYMNGQWYRLTLTAENIPTDPVARLEVSLLSDNLIAPILNITDQRRDNRIDFVGGIRGMAGLEKRVDSGEMAVAFSLYATTMNALMAVADAGEIMPPKSTWFEPKLADGLVSHVLD